MVCDISFESSIKVPLSGQQVINEVLPSISFCLHSDEAVLRSWQKKTWVEIQIKRVPSTGQKTNQLTSTKNFSLKLLSKAQVLDKFHEIYSPENWKWGKKDTCAEMMMLAAIHPLAG